MFEENHITEENSQPAAFYKITVGSVNYFYTSIENDYVVGSNTYESMPGISHGEVRNTGEQQKNKVTIDFNADIPLRSWLLTYVPTVEIFIEIFTIERLDQDQEIIHEFSGIYLDFISNYPIFKMVFAPLDYDSQKQIMRYSFSPICQHNQYDNFCKLNKNDFVLNATVNSIDNFQITTNENLGAISIDHYQGGYIETDGEFGPEHAWIISQINSTSVIVDRIMPALNSNSQLKIYPSCKGKFSNCSNASTFNNRINFFGGIHARQINPFTSSGVKSTV